MDMKRTLKLAGVLNEMGPSEKLARSTFIKNIAEKIFSRGEKFAFNRASEENTGVSGDLVEREVDELMKDIKDEVVKLIAKEYARK